MARPLRARGGYGKPWRTEFVERKMSRLTQWKLIALSPMVMMIAGCAASGGTEPLSGPPPAPAATAPQGAGLAAFFNSYDAAQLSLSPVSKSYRGLRDADYGRWDTVGDDAQVAREKLLQATAAAMRTSFAPATLSEDEQLSVELFDDIAARSAALFPFRSYGYIFDQMNGAHSGLPAFLINIHRVANESEAEAYVSRLRALGPQIDALSAESKRRFEMGIQPPKWVYPYVMSDIDNLSKSARDMQMSSQTLLDDFRSKIAKLEISDERRQALNMAAVAAWSESAGPAYRRLRAEMERQMGLAPTDDGVWRMPKGGEYYRALLSQYTTTDMTATQIHDLGLSEVKRIHGEMRAIMAKVGFKGTLNEFFTYVRTDPKFYHSSREAYIADAETKMAAMQAKLPEYFGVLPKSPLTIKAVEAFREKSAGKAFYQSPAPDGSRPGTYYVNLFNLRDMPITELEALAYHEGVPGHHLQRAVQTELKNVPPFRRFAGFTAYTEGWGLYSEELGKDMGFYTDPYSDFGRLGMELWRACRLVVDTGIHDKRWTREQAIQYLRDNTPNPEGDIVKAIERYIVYPGQATAYTIGKIKIMELRQRAMDRLGKKFDYRAFHDVILVGGPMPLDVLDRRVSAWIAAEAKK
jgi:uncharacterized protein (DUF885 family)